MNTFVRQVKSLKELRLSNNNLEDFGGRRLAEALLENQSLKVCHVSNNKLSKLKYESWCVNDWCTNKDNKPKKILNWKSTLGNTIFYLPKQPKQIAKSEEQIRYEHVMKQLNR